MVNQHAAASVRFVGRGRESEELLAGLEDARSGRGRLFLISGEPGIGKTRLCDEVASFAAARAVPVAWGACWEAGGAPPYWPWVQILRSCASWGGPSSDAGPHLARLAPEVMGAKGDEPPIGDSASSLIEPPVAEDERFRLFDEITNYLKRLAIRVPLLLVVDDLHAADLGTVLMMRFLARNIRQARILALVAYRESEIRSAPTMAELVSDLSREGRSLALKGLSEADTAEFVEFSTHTKPVGALVTTLHRATDGNPFFLTEVVRLLAGERGGADAATTAVPQLAVPDSVRGALLRRLAPLSSEARRILQVASVAGREFDAAVLESLCRATHERVSGQLEEAVTRGLLSETPGSPGRFRFSHFLVTQTLHEELPATARKRLHCEIAEYMTARHAAGAGGEGHLAEVAHHYFQSLPVGPAQCAVSYARRAAAHAMSSLGYEEAARLYKMALEAATLLEPPNETLRCELLLGLGEAQCLALEYVHFKQTFSEAASAARAIKRPDLFARAALGYAMLGNYEATDSATAALLNQALSALGPGDSPLRAALLARLAEEIRWSASPNETGAVIDETIAMARRLCDPVRLAESLFIRYLTLRDAEEGGPATSSERLDLVSEVANIAQAHGLGRWLLRAHYHRGEVLLELNEVQHMYATIETIRRIPNRLRLGTEGLSYSEITEVIDAMRALMEGRIDDGERLASHALAVGSRRPGDVANQIFLAQIVVARREQGRLAELEPVLSALAARHPELSLVRCGAVFCHAESDQLQLARSEFDSLATHDFAQVKRDHLWVACMVYLAETCVALDDRSRADSLYRKLVPCSSHNAAIAFICYLGPIAYYLGILAATMKRFDDARTHFEQALQAAGKISSRPWVARIQYRFARALLDRGRPEDYERARQVASQASATAQALGLQRLGQQVSQLEADIKAGLAPAEGPVLRRDGELWVIASGTGFLRLKHLKGLAYLEYLLRHPGKPVHVLNLIADCDATGERDATLPNGIGDPLNQLSANELEELGLRADDLGDAGEMLDPAAKSAYRSRLEELREQLAEARELNRLERAEQLQDEIEALARELARATGLGGRDRKAASASERARLSVTRAIHAAIERVAAQDASVGRLLSTAIRTGTFCQYSPNPELWSSLMASPRR